MVIKMAKIITVFVDIQESDRKYLEQRQPENADFIFVEEKLSEAIEKHYDKIKDAEILSVFTSSSVPSELLAKFPNLKLVATRSTGFNNIDLNFCNKHDISVVNVPAYGERTVAEYAFALLLNVIRKVNVAYEDLKSGKINLEKYRGHDLFGKTIGLIGTGSIGCYTAKIAYGFGMNILTYDPFPKEFLVEQLGVKYVELDELYEKSDIISLHAPSRKENFHMINDEAFAKMKDGVIIVNTARGEIMDTNALYKALLSGKVAGAGLDVLECEEIIVNESLFLSKIDCVQKECLQKTLINHELLDMPNVIVTPHTAFDTVEAIERILQTTIDNINAYLSGNVINKVN
jgi:D-lactate dehydrogenase